MVRGGGSGAGLVLGVCVFLSFYLPPFSSVDRLCEWRRFLLVRWCCALGVCGFCHRVCSVCDPSPISDI